MSGLTVAPTALLLGRGLQQQGAGLIHGPAQIVQLRLPYTHQAQSPTNKISLLLLVKLTMILDGFEDSCGPDLLQTLYVL